MDKFKGLNDYNSFKVFVACGWHDDREDDLFGQMRFKEESIFAYLCDALDEVQDYCNAGRPAYVVPSKEKM